MNFICSVSAHVLHNKYFNAVLDDVPVSTTRLLFTTRLRRESVAWYYSSPLILCLPPPCCRECPQDI